MAWSAPATPWTSVGEVITSAKVNILADDVRYLKGLAGTVAIEAAMTIAGTAIVSGEVSSVVAAGGSVVAEGTNNGSFSRFRLLAKRTSAAVVDWRILANGVSDTGELVFYDQTAGLERLRIDNAGNVGIGTAAPQGRLHVNGTGGSVLFLSCNAVDGTLQTPVVAGTVTQSAAFWIYDRNNTGGGFVQVSGNMLALGQTFNLVNTDTVAVVVTAGGAITVQRTVGTNATHQVNGIVVFR